MLAAQRRVSLFDAPRSDLGWLQRAVMHRRVACLRVWRISAFLVDFGLHPLDVYRHGLLLGLLRVRYVVDLVPVLGYVIDGLFVSSVDICQTCVLRFGSTLLSCLLDRADGFVVLLRMLAGLLR